MYLLQEKDNP